MVDRMRWRYGDTDPVVAAVDADTVIEIGDLLFLDGDDAKPASYVPDQGTEQANQEFFAGRFLGVAMQRSPAGCDRPVRVATRGVFEFECPPGTFELGDLVGVDESADGVTLCPQQVDKVTEARFALGRAARRAPSPESSVYVAVCSTVMHGGV
ncbi:hypothetical protein JCM19992_02690 [Thermostilla marina]